MKSTLSILVALAVVVPAHLMALNHAMTGGNAINSYQGSMMNHQNTVPTATHNTAGPSAMALYQIAMGSDKAAAKMAMTNMLMNSPKADALIPLMMLNNNNGGNNNNEMLRTMAIMNSLNRGQQGGNGNGMESLLMAMALAGNQEGKSLFNMMPGTQNNGGSSSGSSASGEGGNSNLMDMFMLSRMF